MTQPRVRIDHIGQPANGDQINPVDSTPVRAHDGTYAPRHGGAAIRLTDQKDGACRKATQAAGELSGDIWLDDDQGNSEDVLVAVPLDTAIVVLRYNADTALWQRPTGGWAIFPTRVGGDDTYWVDAHDADGNLIATTEEF